MLIALWGLYKNDITRIRTGLGRSEFFSVNHGLKEGSVLSPLLFSIFVSDLPCFFQKKIKAGFPIMREKQEPLLQYADDTVLLATSIRSLQRLLKTF